MMLAELFKNWTQPLIAGHVPSPRLSAPRFATTWSKISLYEDHHHHQQQQQYFYKL